MRIASGTARGRIIKTPKGRDFRPTEERVRQALGNILAPALGGADVLDLFCGSGAVGLEALSRGAAYAYFVDKDPQCVDCALEHAEAFGLAVAEGGAATVEKAIELLERDEKRFDFIFLDPPYESGLGLAALKQLSTLDLLKKEPQARIIFEHGKKEAAPAQEGRLSRVRQNFYGNSVLSFYAETHAD